MQDKSCYIYQWDLCDPNRFQAALDWFEAAGLNGASMASSYHAGKFLRPGGSRPRVYFPEDGTIYFKCRSGDYGLLRPKEAQCLAQGDVLEQLCNASIPYVHGWTVLLHNSRLGQLHPEVTVQNAFGDRYIYSLCPSHPEARHYARTLCTDLSCHYDLRSLVLETPGFLPYAHGYHHEFALVRQNVWLDHMLGLCFCTYCKQRANRQGLDAARLQKTTAGIIDEYLMSGQDYSASEAENRLAEDLAHMEQLSAYIRTRCDTVTSLVREIRENIRRDVEIFVIPTTQRPASNCWMEGSDLVQLCEVADGIEQPFYEPTPGQIASALKQIQAQIPAESRIRGILRPGFPDLQSPEAVAGACAILEAGGVEAVRFYNYGMLRPVSRQWIADALTPYS